MNNICLIISNIHSPSITKELYGIISTTISIAKESNCRIVAVVIGYNLEPFTENLKKYSLDEIIINDNEIFEHYHFDIYMKQIVKVLKGVLNIKFIFCTDDVIGRDLAGGLSVDLDATVITSAFEIRVQDNILQCKKHIYSDNYIVDAINKSRLAIITVYPYFDEARYRIADKKPIVTTSSIYIEDNIPPTSKSPQMRNHYVDISNASTIVSIGNGITSLNDDGAVCNGVNLISKLADLLNGVIGASRVAVDKGIINNAYQVGLSGKIVSPNLYIACGISGSIQHISGMINSKIILSINNDYNAPIFNYSDYGIVEDMFRILPELVNVLEDELKS